MVEYINLFSVIILIMVSIILVILIIDNIIIIIYVPRLIQEFNQQLQNASSCSNLLQSGFP